MFGAGVGNSGNMSGCGASRMGEGSLPSPCDVTSEFKSLCSFYLCKGNTSV